jgi:hypothetical protein
MFLILIKENKNRPMAYKITSINIVIPTLFFVLSAPPTMTASTYVNTTSNNYDPIYMIPIAKLGLIGKTVSQLRSMRTGEIGIIKNPSKQIEMYIKTIFSLTRQK